MDFLAKNLGGNKFETVSGLNCETRWEISSPIPAAAAVREESISENQAIFPAQTVYRPVHSNNYGTFPDSSPLPPPPPPTSSSSTSSATTEATNDDDSDSESNEDPEVKESQRKENKKRKEKHQRMEGEREKVRKDIRDKYGLKKRDSPRSSDKTKRKHRSPFPSSSSSVYDDKHQLHRRNDSSPSMRRTESPSPHPNRKHHHPTSTHDAPMTSQSKLDVFTSKISSCVVQ